MQFSGISHVAYRCTNAAETVDFYRRHLGLKFSYAVAENRVPSTGEWSPHIHIFLELHPGTYLGFFELSEMPEMQFDVNTPRWVQHLALSVDSVEEVEACYSSLKQDGIDVVGVVDHGIFKSAYFMDPSGHRIEITCETIDAQTLERLQGESEDLLAEWNRTKRAPDVGWHRNDAAQSAPALV